MRILTIFLPALALTICGCSPQFQQMGSNLLSSTGLVSSSQAEAAFSAGSKFARAATPLSEEEEYYLGRGVAAVILNRYQPVKNQTLIAYLNKVGATVVAFSNRPETFGGYHFMILDTDEVNALSAPGGFVFLTKGFLRIIPDEDALASVLAHEVGHIALGHGLKAISQSNLTEALTILGKEAASSSATGVSAEIVSVFGNSIKDVSETLLKNGYSRSQEYDADRYSAEILKRAGYNSIALLSMLDALKSTSSQSGGWYSTHPSPSKRHSQVEDSVNSSNAAGEAFRRQRFQVAVKSLI